MTTNEQQQIYGEGEMAALLSPIFSDPSLSEKSGEEIVSTLKNAYSSVDGEWDDAANDLFSQATQKIYQATQTKPDLSWIGSLEQPVVANMSEDEASAAWDAWNGEVQQTVANDNGVNWLAIKPFAQEALNEYTRQQKRIAQGSDTSFVGDVLRRPFVGASTFLVGGVFGEDESSKAIADWFETNPEYDDNYIAKVAEGVGQIPIQIGVPLAAGVGATLLGGPGAGAAAMLSLSGALGGVPAYRDTYDEVLRNTGSESDATKAGLENALATGSIEAVSNVFVQERLLSPFVKGLTTASKAKMVAGRMAEGAFVEGGTEAAQDVFQQGIQSQFTGKEFNASEALESGAVGAGVGLVTGGLASVVSKTESEVKAQADKILNEARVNVERVEEQLGLPSTEERLMLPPPEAEFTLQGETYNTRDITGNTPPLELPETTPLTPDEEIMLASRVEGFANSDKNFARIKNYSAEQIPTDLLDLFNLTATDEGDGSVGLRKNPLIPEYPTLETDETGNTGEPEINQEAVTAEIEALQTRLNMTPTSADMQSRLGGLKWQYKQLVSSIPRIKNPQGQQKVQTAMRALEGQIRGQETALRKELRFGQNAQMRQALKGRIDELAVLKNETPSQLEVSEGNLTEDSSVELAPKVNLDESLIEDNAETQITTEDITPIESPSEVDMQDVPEAQETETEIPQFMRSKKTGALYSDRITPEHRRLADYWLSGFELGDTTLGTFEDVDDVNFQGQLSDEQKSAIDKARAANYFGEGSGSAEAFAFVGDDGRNLILTRDGAFTPERLRITSHEVGHLVFRRGWQKADQNVRDAVKKDFLEFSGTAIEVDENGKASLVVKDTGVKLSDLSDRLVGPGGKFEGDSRTLNELSDDDIRYLVGDKIGFEEFFANQVSEFLTNPNKKPANVAERLYKNIASQLRDLWKKVRGKFAESQSLQDWLVDVFKANPQLMGPAQGTPREGKGPTRQRNASAQAAAQTETLSEPVREKVGNERYKQSSRLESLANARKKVSNRTVDAEAQRATDFSNDLTPQERVNLASAVIENYANQERAARRNGDAALADELVEKQANVYLPIMEAGTAFGQGIDAFKSLIYATPEGMIRSLEREIGKIVNSPDFKLSGDTRTQIQQIYEKMQDVRNLSESQDVSLIEAQLATNAIAIATKNLPAPVKDALTYMWYGNILSGISTQGINAAGSGMNLFGKTLSTLITQPKNITHFANGLLKGIPKGLDYGKAVFKGTIPSGSSKFEQSALRRSIPPLMKFSNSLLNSMVANPVNFLNNQLQYVFRLMNAVDSFFYRTAGEGQAYLAAARVLRREGIESRDLPNLISEELYNSTEALQTALEQSKREYDASGLSYTPREQMLRAYEIIDQKRRSEIQTEQKRFGLVATYNNRPEGSIGALADSINKLIDVFPPARVVFPFVNVVANVLSNSMDYSPIGLIRAAKGSHTFNSEAPYSPEERLQRLGSGIVGTALGALVYGAADSYLDDEDPYFAIYARGPKSKGAMQSLRNSGWSPYSMKIGDTYIKYSETPLAPIMAWIGEMHDAARYSPSFNRKSPGEQYLYSLAKVGGVIMDMGFLRNAADLVKILQGEKPATGLAVNFTKGFVPASGILRDIAKTTDDFETDPKSVQAQFLKGLPFIQTYAGKPNLNAFGEPVRIHGLFDTPLISTVANPVLGRFASVRTEDPEWRYIAENNLSLSKMGETTSVGISSPKKSQTRKIEALKTERAKTLGRAAQDVLTYEEIYDLTKMSGPEIKKGVRGLMAKNLTSEQAQEELDKLVGKARRNAKIKYFGY